MASLPLPATAGKGKGWTARSDFIRWPRWRSVSDKGESIEGQVVQNESSMSASPQPAGGEQPQLTVDEIMEVVQRHKKYSIPAIMPGIEITDLPNLDDVTQYGVTEEAQEKLWRAEASRLADVVNGADNLFEFKGSQDLAVDSKESYEILADLADQVWQGINIILYDGESVVATHAKDLLRGHTLKKSRDILDYICEDNKDESTSSDKPAPRGSREDLFKFIDHCTAVLARVLCDVAEGKTWQPSIVAALAKASTKLKVLSANPSEFAQTSIDLGVSATRIPLLSDFNRGTGLGGSADSNRPLSASSPSGLGSSGGSDSGAPPGLQAMLQQLRAITAGPLAKKEATSKKAVLKEVYFAESCKFRAHVLSLFELLIVSLRGSNRLSTTSLTSYEICGMVYETGFERFRTLVFQDHEHDLLGSSNPDNINYAHAGFKVLERAARHLRYGSGVSVVAGNEKPPEDSSESSGSGSGTVKKTGVSWGQTPPPAPSPAPAPARPVSNISHGAGGSVGSRISWSYTIDGRGIDGLQSTEYVSLQSMSNVITVIIPFILASPVVVNRLDDFVTTAIFAEFETERQRNPIKPRLHERFTAFFSLTTAEYLREHEPRGEGGPLSLSNALMRRNNLLSGKHIADIGRADSFAYGLGGSSNGGGANQGNAAAAGTAQEDDCTVLERIRRHQRELDAVGNRMKEWIVEEKGVMVSCKVYVFSTMALAALLVFGGLAVGVSVGDRIPAVDPFGITTYCWALAAFVILVAKSVRVQDWSWNDFLHGRVLCRSVSELSSVTSIKEQLILAKLLHEESISILQIRGPYNCVFNRKSADGFSIDRPLSTWTMLLSGLIMIEVESAQGRGLVCLDLRRGTKYEIIRNLCSMRPDSDEEFIFCRRLPDQKHRDVQGDPNRIVLERGKTVWMRALGFYGNKHAAFI